MKYRQANKVMKNDATLGPWRYRLKTLNKAANKVSVELFGKWLDAVARVLGKLEKGDSDGEE